MDDQTRQLQADARRAARLAGSAATANQPLAAGSVSQPGGNATSGTYAWRAAGISNLTSTGDPFYSSPG